MKVANDPTDGLPVDLEEAARQLGVQEAQPVHPASADDLALMQAAWIDAAGLLRIMESRGSTKDSAATSILSQASLEHDGTPIIRSRAKQLVFMPAAFTSKPVERYSDAIIRVWMWWGTLVSADWGGGSFAVKTEYPHGTWTFHGVEFLCDDIRALGFLPKETSSTATPDLAADRARKGSAGRKRKPQWDTFIAELTLAAADGEVSSSMTDTQLLNLVNERLATRGVDEMPRETVRTAIAAVLERFRDDDNDEG